MSASEPVSFPAGEATLRGYLSTPGGAGPFPAVAWSHGSEREPDAFEELARFYTAAGYVFFVPHRRGHGESPGEYAFGTVPPGARAEAVEAVVGLHERALEDTLAAVGWLRAQPLVDAARVVVSGVSHGGVQTLLAAEAGAGAQAYVAFAPAAVAWPRNPEIQDRLVRAVRRAAAPIFLLQAENDYSLGPSEVLGDELRRKGPPNRARVYPPYGPSHATGHADFACRGMEVWGDDVLAFLGDVWAASAS